MSRRFDAAEMYLARRQGDLLKRPNRPLDECPNCKSSRSPMSMPRSARDACRRTAPHVAEVYGIKTLQFGRRDGVLIAARSAAKEVRSAAFVLSKIERDLFRPYENEIERMIAIGERVDLKRATLTGIELLKLVKRVLKNHEHDANR